jgi:F0F1-type ATP synthase delta subunit
LFYVILLNFQSALEKARPILPKVVPFLRIALQSNDLDTFNAALDAVEQLSAVVGPQLNQHLGSILTPIVQKLMKKSNTVRVENTLRLLHENGGEDVYKLIKTKVPTYSAPV